MLRLPTTVDAAVSLSELITSDEALYRVAQALIALTSTPGRRDLRLTAPRQGKPHLASPATHWAVFGQCAATIESAPSTLSLDAGLSHRAHLQALLVSPLTVAPLPVTSSAAAHTTYALQRDGLHELFAATRSLAAALDAQEEARQGVWWGRRSREEHAAQQVTVTLEELRSAATHVDLIPLR